MPVKNLLQTYLKQGWANYLKYPLDSKNIQDLPVCALLIQRQIGVYYPPQGSIQVEGNTLMHIYTTKVYVTFI